VEISENTLIKGIRRFETPSDKITRGIGDDGAVVDVEEGSYVFVQDAMTEHIHFEFSFMDGYDIGRKALYINISDILAMGALPLYFMVTIGIPAKMSYKTIQRMYRGMRRAAREFNTFLLGGDTTEAKTDFFIDVSMVGKVVTKRYLGRNRAEKGDLIGVTGILGESAYGLSLLREGRTGKRIMRFINRYRAPKPPYAVWKELVKHDITTSMMDVSDGLIIDLEKMMTESKKGARVNLDNIPMPRLLRKEGKESLALAGGEDYQFLFTFPPDRRETITAITKMGFPISIIGEVNTGKGVRLFEKGKERKIVQRGYEHFGGTV
jgi:thiamine-monophosphate kinase